MTLVLSTKNKDFFEQVYQVVRLIPSGRVTSYGALANYLSIKSAARMVGWAMNASHSHLVVNRIGLLTGRLHFETDSTMQERLEAEGIKVINNQVQSFSSIFWDPAIELKL